MSFVLFLKHSLNFQQQAARGDECLLGGSHWSPKVSAKSRLSFGQYGAKARIKGVHIAGCAMTEYAGLRTDLRELYLSASGQPASLCVCQHRVLAVTYTEEQCGRESAGECRGCHNRKHGDITCPSGVTEADGAGMRLCDPRGIWLSSFPRQREEERAEQLLLFVFSLSQRAQRHQQTLWFGEGWVPAHSQLLLCVPKYS